MSKWGRPSNFGGVQYVAKSTPAKTNEQKPDNQAKKYAQNTAKSNFERVNSELSADIDKALHGGCFYLPNFFCKTDDLTYFSQLKADLDKFPEFAMVKWSQHFKHENPDFSPTFKVILNKMEEHFDVEIYATRLNFYRDGTDWKPFHHDSHAYGGRELREDFTMGASFGDSRELEFLHEGTDARFKFPQNNGDIFAFTSDVNKKFMHGVPKASATKGPRFSIIAWGRRRNPNKQTKSESDNDVYTVVK